VIGYHEIPTLGIDAKDIVGKFWHCMGNCWRIERFFHLGMMSEYGVSNLSVKVICSLKKLNIAECSYKGWKEKAVADPRDKRYRTKGC
jgi:hypothetical protein